MKKSIVVLAALVSSLMAIGLEITPYGGFQWNGSHDFSWDEGVLYTHGTIDFRHSGNYGLFINFDLPSPGTQLELSWIGCATDAVWSSNSIDPVFKPHTFKAFSNYWHVGILKPFGDFGERFSPYVNTSVGVTLLSAKDDYIEENLFFSVAGGVGAKISITERIGLRFGGRFLVPFNFFESALKFGSDGSRVGGYEIMPILQGDFHGGVIITFGEKKLTRGIRKAPPVNRQSEVNEAVSEIEQSSESEIDLIHE